MADFTVSSMSSAVVWVASTTAFQANLISGPYSLEISSGTRSTGNVIMSSSKNTTPGWLTGRRPAKGQLFPRGIFNK